MLALLRSKDDALAAKYLDATGPYIAMYGKLFGAYPYTKFALVENFWETGYGMPSFTLLGSKVIRLPSFSPRPTRTRSSTTGGATASTSRLRAATGARADRPISPIISSRSRKGDGAATGKSAPEVRRLRLDIEGLPARRVPRAPLAATEAVGYGKALMLFHMMRRELGDDAFVKGLRALTPAKKFETRELRRRPPRASIGIRTRPRRRRSRRG
jgi:hypothetical protein